MDGLLKSNKKVENIIYIIRGKLAKKYRFPKVMAKYMIWKTNILWDC